MIKFAAISPHPPLLMPDVGSSEDKNKVSKTLQSLEKLSADFDVAKIDKLIISSPHPEWGFDVPIYFIARKFKGEIKAFLTTPSSPKEHFELGKTTAAQLKDGNYGLIASGDLSHYLSESGPYGFNAQGPKFDKALIEYLKNKDIEKILNLENEFPEAGDCGLRSLAYVLGIITGSRGTKLNPQILSYEGPFGVGYLVAKLI